MTHEENRLHELLEEAASLQWKLADVKIADRTAGLFANGDVEPLAVQQHVQNVLAAIEDVAEVSERIAGLDSELEDRNRISAAKDLLQKKHGFTEEQAYVYLK
jgi:ANTAR domain